MYNNYSYKGYEDSMTRWKMTVKMHLVFILLTFVVYAALSLGVAYIINSNNLMISKDNLILATKLFFHNDITRSDYVDYVLRQSDYFMKMMKIPLYLCSPILFIYILLLWFFSKRAKRITRPEVIDGAKIISPKELNKDIAKRKQTRGLPIGSLFMPVEAESRHVLLVGSPGTGKTQIMSRVLGEVIKRKQQAIILDMKGDLIGHHYRPGIDHIFNPLDERSINFNIFNQFKLVAHLDTITQSLIPTEGRDPYFGNASRDIFRSVLVHRHLSGKKTNMGIWEMLCKPTSELADMFSEYMDAEDLLNCSTGFKQVEKPDLPKTDSVISVLGTYAKAFGYMTRRTAGPEFIMDDWLNSNDGSNLYVTISSDARETLKPIFSLFVDLLASKVLSLDEDLNRRIFFLLDEFSNLQPLDSILRILRMGRSKGCSVWLGCQSVAELASIYSDSGLESITQSTGTHIFLRSQKDTAKYISDCIGEADIIRKRDTLTMTPKEGREGVSMLEDQRRESLVMASIISQLPDMHAYVRFPGYKWCMTKIPYIRYESSHNFWQCRKDLYLDDAVSGRVKQVPQNPVVYFDDDIEPLLDDKNKDVKSKEEEGRIANHEIRIE